MESSSSVKPTGFVDHRVSKVRQTDLYWSIQKSKLISALKVGDATAISDLLVYIRKNECSQLVELLAAKDDRGIPGLYWALQNGHAKAISAYGELLKLLPKDEGSKLAELLAAKNERGIPGLYWTLQKGHAEAICAYGELLKQFPEIEQSKLAELLAAKNPRGIPGLYFALQDGHAEAISAYGELLKQLPENVRNKVLDELAATNIPIEYTKLTAKKDIQFFELLSSWRSELKPESEAEKLFQEGLDNLNGTDAQKDEEKAVSLLQQARSAGHKEATNTIASFYLASNSMSAISLAEIWFNIALNENHPEAQKGLTDCAEKRKTISANLNSTVQKPNTVTNSSPELLLAPKPQEELTHKNENTQELYRLAMSHIRRLEVKWDLLKGLNLLYQAADEGDQIALAELDKDDKDSAFMNAVREEIDALHVSSFEIPKNDQ